MSSWQLAASTDEYRKALNATGSLTKDNRPVGFVEPHLFQPNLGDTNIQRQNNTLIHLLIQTLEEVKALRDQVQILRDQVDSLSKGKAPEVQLPKDVVDKLAAQLTTTHVTPKGKFRGKGKEGQFRVWS
ncbi:ORF2 [Codonopsis vein clearing virus]|uniref:ORF2 n=1 Tax=Codonopsis vein clearing virus TaxID=2510980 RepID=A0A411AUG2_9VIRU|nr:ORF2 [Codonopsis vein clearing virus]QAX91644.1 ORF2 [Codonopsis vein clearing virus]